MFGLESGRIADIERGQCEWEIEGKYIEYRFKMDVDNQYNTLYSIGWFWTYQV